MWCVNGLPFKVLVWLAHDLTSSILEDCLPLHSLTSTHARLSPDCLHSVPDLVMLAFEWISSRKIERWV